MLPSGVYRSYESAICDHSAPKHARDLYGLRLREHSLARAAHHGSEHVGDDGANGSSDARPYCGSGAIYAMCACVNGCPAHKARQPAYKFGVPPSDAYIV